MITYSTLTSEDIESEIFPLASGTYSVLLVGGGGGGCGQPYQGSRNDKQRISAAGGGSGYAWKGRIIVKEEDVVRVVIGRGGAENYQNGSAGGVTSLYINDVLVNAVMGGQGAYFVGERRDDSQFTDSFAVGGDGASGGGSADGDVMRINRVWEMRTPGAGGYDGGDGKSIVNKGLSLFESGKGVGNGYYASLHNAIDPDILHLDNFPTMPFGGSACLVTSQHSLDELVNRAGGGGGYGTRYLSQDDTLHTTGHGFGAGGGGGYPGIRGVASFIRIDS